MKIVSISFFEIFRFFLAKGIIFSFFKEGKIMKNATVCVFRLILLIVFCSFILFIAGCKGAQPGRTAAEVEQDRIRKKRIEGQQLREEIDKVLLTDKPSRLSDKRVP